MKYGLSTREREAAEMTGSDYEENIEQLAYEQSLMAAAGITDNGAAPATPTEGGDNDEEVLANKERGRSG